MTVKRYVMAEGVVVETTDQYGRIVDRWTEWNDDADRCAVCGERGNAVPLSMAGTMHRYGPLADHDYTPAIDTRATVAHTVGDQARSAGTGGSET